MTKALAINGSPRTERGNTARLLTPFHRRDDRCYGGRRARLRQPPQGQALRLRPETLAIISRPLIAQEELWRRYNAAA